LLWIRVELQDAGAKRQERLPYSGYTSQPASLHSPSHQVDSQPTADASFAAIAGTLAFVNNAMMTLLLLGAVGMQ
jgi:hypothetical protein